MFAARTAAPRPSSTATNPGSRPLGTGPLLLLLLGLLIPLGPRARAQDTILVEGLANRTVLTDRVTFRVRPAPGFTLVATLDGQPVPVGSPVDVTEPDYHELRVQSTSDPSGTAQSRLVQFIVRDSERGDSEWGLPPWTPPPTLASSPEELAAGSLRLMVPSRFPVGLPIPLVAWLDGPDGHALRANAELTSELHPPIWIRRGTGAGRVPAAPAAPPILTWTSRIPGQSVDRTLEVESAPVWQTVGGTLTSDVTWAADSRIDVARTLTVPAGTTLGIDAGTVVRLAAGADFVVQGQVLVRGRTDRPVAFVPQVPTAPWGGFVVQGTAARLDATAAFFVDSGANSKWFTEHSGYDVHRKEQALFLVDDGARVILTDCAAFDGHGQFGHGRNGFLTLERTLVQRFITGGEYNGGNVTIRDSALLEFPADDGVFADEDNDAIYFTSGNHVVADSVIGWARDDGIDAGSGGAGTVLATNVWVEATFHEAFAWSGTGRSVTNLHCVAFRCGQGIECGWSGGPDSPRVYADDCLSLGNLSGLRFGDNYDWTYNGFLRVTNSIVLHNHRDIYDRNWDDWSARPAQLDVQGNLITRADPDHVRNSVWDSARDGSRLGAFVNTPAAAPAGVGFGARSTFGLLTTEPITLSLELATFTTRPVEVNYVVETPDAPLFTGRARFEPGETQVALALPSIPPADFEIVRVRLAGADGVRVSGPSTYYLRRPSDVPGALIPRGSEWRYFDLGTDPGADWAGAGFADGSWKTGRAQFGYGDGDETTTINGGPVDARFAAAFFRRSFDVPDPSRYTELEARFLRDDGGIVHLNGTEVFRSNMPSGPVTFATYAAGNTSSESQFFTQRIPASLLRPGRNVVAVEVHQANAGSSDLSFDLELVGVPEPRLGWLRFGDDLVLSWESPSYRLQQAAQPEGPWIALATGDASATVVRPGTPRFYRLAKATAADR